MVGALARLEEIRALGINQLDVSRLPAGRIQTLARHAASFWAANITRMPEQRRIATMVAFALVFEIVAQDDALDLLDQLITRCLARAESAGEKERLRTIRDLDAASIRLCEIGKVVVNLGLNDQAIRPTAFRVVPAIQIEQDIATVTQLTRPPDDNYYEFLLGNYSTIRRFLPDQRNPKEGMAQLPPFWFQPAKNRGKIGHKISLISTLNSIDHKVLLDTGDTGS